MRSDVLTFRRWLSLEENVQCVFCAHFFAHLAHILCIFFCPHLHLFCCSISRMQAPMERCTEDTHVPLWVEKKAMFLLCTKIGLLRLWGPHTGGWSQKTSTGQGGPESRRLLKKLLGVCMDAHDLVHGKRFKGGRRSRMPLL